MDDDIKATGQNDDPLTVHALVNLCRQYVLARPQASLPNFSAPMAEKLGSMPTVTVAAVVFFVLEWATRLGVIVTRADAPLVDSQGEALSRERVTQRINLVIHHLEQWGGTVAALQVGDAHEWELVGYQMGKALQRFNCRREDKEDVLQKALMKLFLLVKKMPTIGELISVLAMDTDQIIALVEKHRKNLGRLYNFSSSFYHYARAVAENEMLSLLKPGPFALLDLDEVLDRMVEASDDAPVEMMPASELSPEAIALRWEEFQEQIELLRVGLVRLLHLISTQLSEKNQKVIYSTLAARPRFWQALALTEVAAPAGLSPLESGMADAQLAHKLGMSENNLRVSRNQAKRHISECDALAGVVLEALLKRIGTE